LDIYHILYYFVYNIKLTNIGNILQVLILLSNIAIDFNKTSLAPTPSLINHVTERAFAKLSVKFKLIYTQQFEFIFLHFTELVQYFKSKFIYIGAYK